MIDVAIDHLAASDLRHGVNELSVEEALVAGVCLLGTEFELARAWASGRISPLEAWAWASGQSERDKGREKKSNKTKDEFHNAPLEERCCYFLCSRVMRRWRASHSSSGNWPFATERNCLYRSVACFDMVKLIVSRCF